MAGHHRRGNFTLRKGRVRAGSSRYQEVAGRGGKELDQISTETAASLNNLAELYRSRGLYAQASPLYVRARQSAKSGLGQIIPWWWQL